MITLKNDVVSLTVEDKNPLYKVLSKFIGETFQVHQENKVIVEPEISDKKEKKPAKQDINRESVWNKFYTQLDYLLEEKTLVGSILKAHTLNVLDGEQGMVKLEKVEGNLFKNNDLFLLIRE